MKAQPTLQTERLLLRSLQQADAPIIKKWAGEKAIAENTFVPHPYKEGMAEEYINQSHKNWDEGSAATFGIILKKSDSLIGTISLKDISKLHSRAEMGYWIATPYWRKGYATEAAKKILHFAFVKLNLNRVFAGFFHTNPASGRVQEKIGMKKEGIQRQHIYRFGEYKDLILYAILKEDWEKSFVD